MELSNYAAGLPGISSDRQRVLAYSCAAARDLHPLPILVCGRQRHANPDVCKERNNEEQTIIGREGEVNRSVSAACLGLSELHQPGDMCIASHEWICTHRANARLGESQLFYVFVRHFTSEEI